MDALFGDKLCQYSAPANEGDPCTKEVPIAEALPESVKHIGVIFSA